MKKRIISAVMALIMLITCIGITVMVSAEDESTDIVNDFQSCTVGELPQGWSAGSPTIVNVQEENDNKFLRMDTSKGASWFESPLATSGRFEMSYRMRMSNTNIPSDVWVVANADNPANGLIQGGIDEGTGRFQLRDTSKFQAAKSISDENAVQPLVNDRWYEIKWVVDAVNFKEQLYIDGVLCDSWLPFRFQDPNFKVNKLRVKIDRATQFDIDDFEIKNLGENELDADLHIDFSGAQSNAPVTWQPGFVYAINKANHINFNAVSGKFGKGTDDTSLYLHNDAGEVGGDPFVQVKADQMIKANYGKVSSGNVQVLSFNAAFDDSMAPIVVNGKAYSEDNGGDGKLNRPFIQLNKDGSISVFGNKVLFNNDSFRPNVWYNVKLVLYAGDDSSAEEAGKNKFSVYINNEPVAENLAFAFTSRGTGNSFAKRNQYRGIKEAWFNCPMDNAKNEDGTFKASGFYIDDIKMFNAANSYTPLKSTMIPNDSSIAKFINYPYAIFAADSLTVEQVKNVTIPNGSVLAVSDVDGTEVLTGSASGKYLRIKDYACDELYIPITKSQMDYTYTAENIAENAVDPTAASAPNWTTAEGGSWFKWNGFTEGKTLADNVAGMNGKSLMLGVDSASEDNLHFIVKAPNEALPAAYEPMTIEANVYTSSKDKSVELWAYMDGKTNNSSSGHFDFLYGMRNNQINCASTYTEYPAGRWYKFAVTFYPASNQADIYLNGQLTKTTTIDFKYINGFRFVAKEDAEGFAAINNIKVKNGVYNPEAGANIKLQEGAEDVVTVNDKEKTITLTEEIDVDSMTDIFNMNGITYSLYSDSTLANKVMSGNMTNGNVLAAAKNDIYSYYTIIYEQPEPRNDITYKTFDLSDDGDKKVVTISGIDNATDKDINVAVIVATYDAEGRLVSVGMEKVKVNANTKHDGNVSARAVFTAGNSVKYFVWDIDTLKPIEKLD